MDITRVFGRCKGMVQYGEKHASFMAYKIAD